MPSSVPRGDREGEQSSAYFRDGDAKLGHLMYPVGDMSHLRARSCVPEGWTMSLEGPVAHQVANSMTSHAMNRTAMPPTRAATQGA